MASNFYEVEHSKRLRMVAQNRWAGIRSFLCKASLVSTLSRQLYDQPFPSMTGVFTAKVYSTDSTYHPLGVPGAALMLVYYRTPLIPGQAIVKTRITTEGVVDYVDRDGKVITGPNRYDTGSNDSRAYFWKVTKGTPLRYEGRCQYIVETAIRRADHDDNALWRLRGTSNRNAFNLRGFKPPETLLFRGYRSVDTYKEDPIPITYQFDYNPAGWNNTIETQKGSFIITEEQVFREVNGIMTDQSTFRSVKRPAPGWDAWAKKNSDGTFVGARTVPEKRASHPNSLWIAIPDTGSW